MFPTKSYAAAGPKAALEPYTIERREPGPQDVLIDIHYCGICHSDIHQVCDEWFEGIFPMVPGHEIVGVVREVGKDVTKYKAGDRVGVGCFVDSCRSCKNCNDGFEQYCAETPIFTYNATERGSDQPTYGGYSSCITVDEDYVLRVPENLPMDASAPLLCAGITLYSPLRHWHVGPGKKVAIVGLGGLGHIGVKLAVGMGAEVSVISHSESKRKDAESLGAHHFYHSAMEDFFMTHAGQFDLIINTVSAPIDWNPYLGLLVRDGSMVNVGLPEEDVPVNAFALAVNRKSLSGSAMGGIAETQEMLDFCGMHNIVCDVETIEASYINQAFERVVKSDVHYRFVIDISTL